MAITVIQEATTRFDAATDFPRAFVSNVAAGSLVVVVVWTSSTAAFVAGNCTKSAGTATIGTVQLDKENDFDVGAGEIANAAIWSVLVTGAGSLTMNVAVPDSTYGTIVVGEYGGSWDSARLEDSQVGQNATDNTTAIDTANLTSAGAGLFIGATAVMGSETLTSITPNSPFTSLASEIDNTSHQAGAAARNNYASGTTDTVGWTLPTNTNRGWTAVGAVYKEAAAGGTVNTQTLTDTLSVADSGISSAVRGRIASDTLDITEGGLISSTEYGIVGDDVISVTDSGTQFAVRGRISTDTLDVSDQALWFMLRHRLLTDGIDVADDFFSSIVGNNILTRVLTSQILLADEALPYVFRNRLLESSLDVVDEAALFMLRYRLLESGIALTDEALSQIVGGNVISRVLTSTVVMADDLLKALLIVRSLDDFIVTDDGLLTAMQRFILLTDVLSVQDDATATFVGQATYEPAVRVGFDQPDIDIGGYAVH